MDEAHRVLLTYLRATKCVPVATVAAKFPLLAENGDENLLRQYISTINVNLERFGFKIDTVRDQRSDTLQYVFINTRFDDVIQACTPYLPPELDAVKQLVDNIVNSHDFAFSLPYGNAKQHTASVLKQRASDAELLLRRLVDDGWLAVSDRSRVLLSETALAELRIYLVDRFGVFSADDALGKLLLCVVCSSLVTTGTKCVQAECSAAFHSKCFTVYSRNHELCQCGEALEQRAVGEP